MASRGINKVILIGHLGQDPEVRYTSTGVAIANLTVATSETWRDKQTNEQREQTEWHRIVLYRRLAEIAGEYLRKGAKVYIEGKLQTRQWTDQNGQTRYTTEVVAQELQMLDGRNQNTGTNNKNWSSQNAASTTHNPSAETQQTSPPKKTAPATQSVYNEPPMDFDDDIPF